MPAPVDAPTALGARFARAGLRLDGATSVWRHRARTAAESPAGPIVEACSPVLAAYPAALDGPVLVVQSAPAVRVAALLGAGHEVAILGGEGGRARELAEQHGAHPAVAVVHAPASSLPAGFGSVIALGGVTAGAAHDLARLLTGAGLPVQDWFLLFPEPVAPALMIRSGAADPRQGIDLESLPTMKSGSGPEARRRCAGRAAGGCARGPRARIPGRRR